MNFLRLLPVIMSLLLLAAHYYRAGFVPLVAVTGAGVLILLVRRPWAVGIVRTLLIIGGIEWTRTTVELVRMRQSVAMPWLRLSLILGGVTVFTVAAMFVFRFAPLRRRYKID